MKFCKTTPKRVKCRFSFAIQILGKRVKYVGFSYLKVTENPHVWLSLIFLTPLSWRQIFTLTFERFSWKFYVYDCVKFMKLRLLKIILPINDKIKQHSYTFETWMYKIQSNGKSVWIHEGRVLSIFIKLVTSMAQLIRLEICSE